MYMYSRKRKERKTDFEKWVAGLCEAGRSITCMVGWQARDPGRLVV
jgi:hypothetical protein